MHTSLGSAGCGLRRPGRRAIAPRTCLRAWLGTSTPPRPRLRVWLGEGCLVAEPLRIPIADARCPWCGSEVGEWCMGSTAACLASGWATRTVAPTACPVDWRGGQVESWRDGLYLRLDDPRDVAAWQMRRSLDIAEMQAEQGRDVITELQVGSIIARADAAHWKAEAKIEHDALNELAADANRAWTESLATNARHRVATVIGAVQSVVGLVLAAWWPTDPGAIAATALVVGGSLAMIVGGWPAVRRTLTEQP